MHLRHPLLPGHSILIRAHHGSLVDYQDLVGLKARLLNPILARRFDSAYPSHRSFLQLGHHLTLQDQGFNHANRPS